MKPPFNQTRTITTHRLQLSGRATGDSVISPSLALLTPECLENRPGGSVRCQTVTQGSVQHPWTGHVVQAERLVDSVLVETYVSLSI